MRGFFHFFSKSLKFIKVGYAKFHLFLSKVPFYSITLFSFRTKSISNKLNLSFPSEYSIDLISKSHICILKCSGKSIFIRDIPEMLVSETMSYKEKAELQSFSWISLLNLDADRQWRIMIRSHIKFWIKNFKRIEGPSWDISVISERIYNWIVQYNLISKTSDAKFNASFVDSLKRQTIFLNRCLYLPLSPLEKTSLIRAIIVASSAANDNKIVISAINELADYLRDIDRSNSCKTTQEMLKVLRNLIDIQSIILACKIAVPIEISNTSQKLANIIRSIRHSDGGISIFQSEFTPSSTYVDAVLSHVRKTEQQNFDSGYLRLQSIDSTAFINLKNKYFPIEFSAGTQRIIFGSYLYFTDQNLSFSANPRIEHSLHKEKSNIWFSGRSFFSINQSEVNFGKKIYINNLGTDIRCEEVLSNSTLNTVNYIVLPNEIDITLLEYQNGFFMDFKSGTRWVWNFNKNVTFSFDFDKNGILNGEKRYFILLALTTSSPNKNVLRWSLKKI